MPEEPRSFAPNALGRAMPLDNRLRCSDARSDAAPSYNRSQGKGDYPSDDRGDAGSSPLRKREPALRRAQPKCRKTESRKEKDKYNNLQECLRVRSNWLRSSIASSTVSASADDHSSERSNSTRRVMGALRFPGRNRQFPATGCDDPPPVPTCFINIPRLDVALRCAEGHRDAEEIRDLCGLLSSPRARTDIWMPRTSAVLCEAPEAGEPICLANIASAITASASTTSEQDPQRRSSDN
jgi:hypothetical protein